MIVIDTSALMAIIIDEPKAAACLHAMASADQLIMSAGTLAEAMIVAAGRKLIAPMVQLIEPRAIEIVAVTSEDAQRVALAYQSWGRGFHPAGLNFGDCFAYALARSRNCPLLFVGNDFSRTDIVSAL